jgi:FkbM family methyltransferase
MRNLRSSRIEDVQSVRQQLSSGDLLSYDWSNVRAAVQHIALRGYRSRVTQSVLATPLGRTAFETAYFCYKDWIEAPGSAALRRYVEPGDWIFDVGANIGYFTGKFATWVTAGGKVVALEPELTNYTRLNQRIAQQGVGDRVITRQSVAADIDGELKLAVNPEHPGDHSLSDQGIPITAYRLDSLWRAFGEPRIALLKIDVQGAEMRVLCGAADMVANSRPVMLLEIDHAALTRFGSSSASVLDWLERYGYAFHELSRSGIAPFPRSDVIERVAGPPASYCDVLAVPMQQARNADG